MKLFLKFPTFSKQYSSANCPRIAKLNEIHELANVNTETVSTLQYMSPEAMSQSIYSTESDVYAFGIVAFEILFEREAFGNLEGFKLIDAVVNKRM